MSTVLGLFKLRIGIVIALTALAGFAIAPGPARPAWQVALLVLGVLLASASAGAFNQFHEAELDRAMQRTRGRAFATGRLKPHAGWLAAILGLCGAGIALAWWAVDASAALFNFLGAFFYAIVYTVWLKRRTWWNIVIGGLAGSFAVMAGAAAASGTATPEALLLAGVLFLWTPPHFWSLAIACRDDYAAARVPMLPVVKGDRTAARAIFAHTLLLVPASMALLLFTPGWFYGVCAALGNALFVRHAWRLLRTPDRAHAMRSFHASLAQLSLILIGAMLDAAIRA